MLVLTPRLCAIALLFFYLASLPLLAQQDKESNPSGSTIRLSVNHVDVGVTVTNSSGHFVKGLKRKDFKIFDNGVEQPIDSFGSNEDATQIVFLIESGAGDTLLARIGKSPFAFADNLVQSLSPLDRVAIATYSKHASVNLEFTDNKQATRQALRELNAELRAGASGYGSLNLAASITETLDWLAAVPGNKTIVLISSGIDTSPVETWQNAQLKLQTSTVRILGISLLGDFRQPFKHQKLSPDQREDMAVVKSGIVESDRWLEKLTAATGGRVYLPKNAKDFHHAFNQVAQLVRSEYALEFVPTSLDGQLHSIQVRVKHLKYHVEYREAYLAPSPTLPSP
jgi:VWFA-related protein